MVEMQMRNESQLEEDRAGSNPQPSQGCLTQFEKVIVRECREMGMTDGEIEKWLMEI